MNRLLSLTTINRLAALAVACGIAFQNIPSSVAWDGSIGIDGIEYLYVDFATGGYTMTTLEEGLRADSGTGSSLPNNPISQAWNGTSWPSDIMNDQVIGPGGVTAQADLEHYDGVTDEFFDYAEAFVFGDLPPDTSYGAAWFYDFQLTVDPGASVNLFLDSDGVYGLLESQPGDNGFAFLGVRLFSSDVDINDPGGINDPYDLDTMFLASPPSGGFVDGQLGLSHTFDNFSGSPAVYNLRLQGSVSIFEPPVPEPSTLGLISLGGVVGLGLRRRHK